MLKIKRGIIACAFRACIKLLIVLVENTVKYCCMHVGKPFKITHLENCYEFFYVTQICTVLHVRILLLRIAINILKHL